ncbi:hypothetical protein N7495_004148 [Penicillium taxi]|uniref:uncharacterized protein n=1 Tax=Penicillium taxi TaxID=168475 RepID=UPI0025453DA3|nr:uncharacterized protein N7495_004148 [Penicillium taxi]KAJ5899404.1 hypothetical protein N7495_004148 [Penicillium taxi]
MINRWLSFLLAISTVISSTASTPLTDISKRDKNRLTCDLTEECTSWYNTGDGNCQPGFLRSDLLAEGSLPGSTCQKKCSKDEAKKCAVEWCKFDTAQCHLSPESLACNDALRWCKTPIKMSEKICTAKHMKSPVKYDSKKGTCAPVKNETLASEYHLFMDLGPSNTSIRLFIGCGPLTKTGVEDVYNSINHKFKIKPCSESSTGSPTLFPKWKCYAKASQLKDIKNFAEKACKAADHPGSKKPVFEGTMG